MLKTGYIYALLTAAVLVIGLTPGLAWANATLDCDSGTGFLFEPPYQNAPDGWRIFSWIIYHFINILNNVLGSVYCGLVETLTDLMAIVFSIYIAILGAQLLMGTASLTVKEVVIRMLKIAGVWTFATSSTWGISYAFFFFVSFSIEGTNWVLSGIPGTSTGNLFGTFSECGGASTGTSAIEQYEFLDILACQMLLGPFLYSDSKVIGFFVALAVVLPPLFWIAAYWIWMNFTLLVRALISYLLGLAALAFLISLSPIFLSLMLFKITHHFFESWLKYMISYSLQIVIVFACIGMWLAALSNFVYFFKDMSCMIYHNKKIGAESALSDPDDSFGICPYGLYYSGGVLRAGCQGTQNQGGGYHQDHQEPGCNNGGFDPYDFGSEDSKNLIPLSKVPEESWLIYFIAYNLITLILVSYAFTALMKAAPKIAQQLAGPEYVPILGQGFGYSHYGQIKGLMPRSQDGSSGGSYLQKLGFSGSSGSASSLLRRSPYSGGDLVKSFVQQAQKQLGNIRNTVGSGKLHIQ